MEQATLAGGCFWCLEAVFEQLEGVESVAPGFAGGDPAVRTYREVCEGASGHAEVVRIVFDPTVVSYRELLEFFFAFHDPTTLDRQGGDVGTQYRSAIFWHTPEQRDVATKLVAELGQRGIWPDPIVTQIVPLENYFEAEEYHHGYYRRNSSQPYCRAVIAPKLAKLRQHWATRLKGGAPR